MPKGNRRPRQHPAARRSTQPRSRVRRVPATAPRPRGWESTWTSLDRRDLFYAGAVSIAAAGICLPGLRSFPALGDAPESVAGVASLGILHAPGYPAYVLLGRLATLVIPAGTLAFRLALFSLLCSAIAVGGVAILARLSGAARWASVIAAAIFAVGPSFRFYSTFDKYDALASLLLVAALISLMLYVRGPTGGRAAAAGGLLGLGLSASWQLTVLLGPAICLILFVGRRRIRVSHVLVGASAGLLPVVACYGFVLVRAGANPPVNWGYATDFGRLVHLVTLRDLGIGGTPGQGKSTVSLGATAAHGKLPILGSSLVSYFVVFARELGVFGLLLGALGLTRGLRRRSLPAAVLSVVFLTNLFLVALVAGPGSHHKWAIDLIEEGFLFGNLVPLAAGAGLALTQVDEMLRRYRPAWFQARGHLGPAALATVALLGIFQGLLESSHAAQGPDLEARYASTVFSELPRDAVLIVVPYERSAPLLYRQVVAHQRQDVLVLYLDALGQSWYRAELSARLHRRLPGYKGNIIAYADALTRSLQSSRPVYLDAPTTVLLGSSLSTQPVGLLSIVTFAPRQNRAELAIVSKVVDAAEQSANIYDAGWAQWPNTTVRDSYAYAELALAKAYSDIGDVTDTAIHLRALLRIQPDNAVARDDLAQLGAE
ncbi:MAG TPA: DUF2723 domain-containing protein [Mycobacteriales bacterium]|nr:DUF2723 domain-containing protein [Mycobacteriales bacterium]